MTDDLERRLEQLGATRTTPMSVADVDALEARLMSTARRQVPWRPLLATAAAVLLLAGAVFAMQRTDNDSLRPATTAPTSTVATPDTTSPTSTTVATTTTTVSDTTAPQTTSAPTPEPTVPGGVPPTVPGTIAATTPPTMPTTIPATIPATAPPTAPPTTPSTTQPPVVIPPASFTLSVQRVGDRLVFTWPAYTGADGRQYVLVRVGPAGLNTWPVAQVRIGAIVGRMNVTTTAVIQPNTESRRWVLAVVGENRTLLAVSSVTIST